MMKTIWFSILFFVLMTSPVVCGKIPESHANNLLTTTSAKNTISCRVDNSVQRTKPVTRLKVYKKNYIKKIVSCKEFKSNEETTTTQKGKVSYYYYPNSNHKLASGEKYTSKELTAAHRTLPFGTMVKVTRLDTKQSVIVKINDRGPFIRGRIIDLNILAAKQIGIAGRKGIDNCKIEIVRKGKDCENELSLLSESFRKDRQWERILGVPENWNILFRRTNWFLHS